MSEIALVIAAVVIFVLVFVCSAVALIQQSPFGRTTSIVVSLCTAILSVLGLLRPFGKSSTVTSEPIIEVILLPYAVLPILFFVLLLVWLLGKLKRRRARSYEDGSVRKASIGSSSSSVRRESSSSKLLTDFPNKETPGSKLVDFSKLYDKWRL